MAFTLRIRASCKIFCYLRKYCAPESVRCLPSGGKKIFEQAYFFFFILVCSTLLPIKQTGEGYFSDTPAPFVALAKAFKPKKFAFKKTGFAWGGSSWQDGSCVTQTASCPLLRATLVAGERQRQIQKRAKQYGI